MKKLVSNLKIMSLVFLSLPVISSCKKSSDDNGSGGSTYYVKFKANGVQKEYSSVAIGLSSLVSTGYYSTVIEGENAASIGSEGLGISISGSSSFTTGTYTDANISIDGSEVSQAIFEYVDNTGATYASSPSSVAPNITVIVSEANSTDIKGTFSGIVQLATGSTTVAITEGEFVVKVE